MLNAATRKLVKDTVPVLREHGVTLTRHFYQRMFEHNPELKHLFNQAHQASGEQQQALAMAVLAYAENIEDPSVLQPVLTRVAHKHASLGIRAEHYPIVGMHLLAAIREVMGDAASDALIDAWAAAYGQLADMFVDLESTLYRDAAIAKGGWSGWRPFKVGQRVQESDEITSFYLYPVDGGAVPQFLPGQFVSVRGRAGDGTVIQPRQYSLSDAPNESYLRLSIKRESGQRDLAGADRPNGIISNWMHDEVSDGDLIELSPPFGDFNLHLDRQTPVVLISGGVGLTPMVSMLNHVIREQPDRSVTFVHGARHRGVHALSDHIRELTERHARLDTAIFYEVVGPEDRPGVDYHFTGRVDLAAIRERVIKPQADYYLCGPVPFMRAKLMELQSLGVPGSRIHYEVFGSSLAAAA